MDEHTDQVVKNAQATLKKLKRLLSSPGRWVTKDPTSALRNNTNERVIEALCARDQRPGKSEDRA